MPNYLQDDQSYMDRIQTRQIKEDLTPYMNPKMSADPTGLEWMGHAAEFVFSKLPTTWLQKSGLALATHDFNSTDAWGRIDEAWEVAKKVTGEQIKMHMGDPSFRYGKAFVEEYLPSLPQEHQSAAEMAVEILTDPGILLSGAGLVKKGSEMLLRGALRGGLRAGTSGLKSSGLFTESFSNIAKAGFLAPEDAIQAGKLVALADRGDKAALQGLTSIMDKGRYANGFDQLMKSQVVEEVAKYKAVVGAPDSKLIKDMSMVSDIHANSIIYGLDDTALQQISQLNLTKANAIDVFNAIGKNIDAHTSRLMSRFGASQKMFDAVTSTKLEDVLMKDVSKLTFPEKVKLEQGIATVSGYVESLAARAMKTGDVVTQQAVQEGINLLGHMDEMAKAIADGAGDDVIKALTAGKSGAASLDTVLMSEVSSFKIGDKGALARLNSEFVSQLDSPHKMMRFVQGMKTVSDANKNVWDGAYKVFIHSVLSGPQTHVANTVSNTAYMMMQPITTFVSAVPKLLYAPKEALATIDSARQMVHGMVESFGDALKLSVRFNSVQEGKLATKFRYDNRLFRGHEAVEMLGGKLDKFGYGFDGRAADALTHLSAWKPGDWLMREDFFFKTMNYRMSARVEAANKARQMVKDGLSTDFKSAFARALDDPTEMAVQRGLDFATVNTFQKQLGETGGAIRLALQGPGLRWFFPFFRTQLNLVKIGAEHSPLGYFKVLNDMAKGSTQAAELAFTRASMGSAMMMYVVNNVDASSITGTWEKGSAYDDLMRSVGAPEYSIKFGDKWYDYSRIEPLRYVLGMAANYKRALDNLDLSVPENLNTLNVLGSITVEPFAKVSMDNRFLVTLNSVINMIQDLRKGSVSEAGANAAKRLVSSFVPNALRQFNSQYVDPTFREADNFIARSLSKIPGMSSVLPPHRNLFGDPIVTPEGLGPDILSPVAVHSRKYNAIVEEIQRIGMPLERPDREVFGVRLNDEEYSKYAELAGKGSPRYGLPPVEQTLKELIISNEYKSASDKDKRELLKYFIGLHRKSAREILVSESPDLLQRAKEQEQLMRSLK